MSKSFFPLVWGSYQDAIRGKKHTQAVSAFRMHEECLLEELYNELATNQYRPGKSTFFVIHDPVQREICASAFRDRVVHHIIHTFLEPHFDPRFIADSYGARTGKWVHYGVAKIIHFLRQATQNNTRQAWVMKLDIQWFFMSIDQSLLKQKIYTSLSQYASPKYPFAYMPRYLRSWICAIIDHQPQRDYTIRWSRSDRAWLPRHKSLFHTPPGKWLPLGNLTSQLFANIYLDSLDQWVKHTLKIKRYGRYMDDMVFIDTSKERLLAYKEEIDRFLQIHLQLKLHPHKVYLQPVEKWVPFLWYRIFPRGYLLGKRTIANWRKRIHTRNRDPKPDLKQVQASTNSYLWLARHGKNYHLRRQMVKKLRAKISNMLLSSGGYKKLVFRVKKVKKL